MNPSLATTKKPAVKLTNQVIGLAAQVIVVHSPHDLIQISPASKKRLLKFSEDIVLELAKHPQAIGDLAIELMPAMAKAQPYSNEQQSMVAAFEAAEKIIGSKRMDANGNVLPDDKDDELVSGLLREDEAHGRSNVHVDD